MLDDMAKQFDTELNAQLGLAEAEISSARPLSEDGKRAVGIAVGALDRQERCAPSYSSDPELLGGVVVRVGSTIYDGSVRGQLEKISRS